MGAGWGTQVPHCCQVVCGKPWLGLACAGDCRVVVQGTRRQLAMRRPLHPGVSLHELPPSLPEHLRRCTLVWGFLVYLQVLVSFLIFASLESSVGPAQWLCRPGWPRSSPSQGSGLTQPCGEQLARLRVADSEGNVGVRCPLVLPASREPVQDPDQGQDRLRTIQHICNESLRLLGGTPSRIPTAAWGAEPADLSPG